MGTDHETDHETDREPRPTRGSSRLTLMQAAVEQASDAIIITTADLDAPGPEIVYVNPAFTRMTGYSADEALGRSPRFLQGPQTERAVLDRLRAQLARGEHFQGRTVNHRKNGSPYLLDWQIAPIRDPAGAITHFVAIQQDVSEIAEMEVQLRQAQKMEALGRLAGGVAHDFNNLLLVIGGNAHFLREAYAPGTGARADIDAIEAAVQRAAALTRQLLAFSRKQVRQPRVLDLNAVVANVGRMLARVIGEDVRLTTELAPGVVPVIADAGQLEQVLLNLAVNARDAMPEGGTLAIRTRVDAVASLPPGRVPTSGSPTARVALLSVSDTGVGMSAETRERAFEPFYTTKEVGTGTGLGLATVHGIIEQSEGTVWIDSAPGAGTTVWLALPTAEWRVIAAVPGSVAAPPRATGTVLLVEDDAAVRALTTRLLATAGYTVVEARDTRDALARWAEHEAAGDIDALVSDLVMPDGGGYDLLVRLRATRPDLPAVFLSGYAPDARVATALAEDSHRTAFLEKPFDAAALWEHLARVLPASHRPGTRATTRATR